MLSTVSMVRRWMLFGAGRRRLREPSEHASEILLQLGYRGVFRIHILRVRRQRQPFRHVRRMRKHVPVQLRLLTTTTNKKTPIGHADFRQDGRNGPPGEHTFLQN